MKDTLHLVRQCTLAGFLFLLTSFIPNQPENIIKKYGVKDGLSLGIVTSITQDNKGLMWFATEDGLNRFDGYAFKSFKYDPDHTYTLTGNFIQKVFKDSEGVLWVSSRHGLNRFDAKTERFTHYRHIPGDKSSIVGNDISDITESAAGNLWVASYNAGFSYYDRGKNMFIPYNQQTLPALSSNKVISLHQDGDGLLWVGTQDAGLNVFKVQDGIVSEKVLHLSQTSALPSPNIKCIYEDHFDNIWIGTTRGLVLYQRQKGRYFVFDAKKYALGSNIILSVLEDSKEMLWIGVQDGGVYKLDIRQLDVQALSEFSFAEVKGKDGTRLTQRSVQALYEDKDHNMWVGTYGDGINMISNEKEKFIKMHLRSGQTAVAAEGDIRYYGICTDSEGNLWLGTDGSGIYKCSADGEVLKHYTARKGGGGLTDDAILCALQDAEHNLWFGSYAQGLFLYNKETDSFVNFKHARADASSLGGNDVRVIFEDAKHNIWIGTNGGGLSLFNQNTGSFKNFNTANSSITSNDIRAIAEDKGGRLWIGTYGGGLYSFSRATQTFTKHYYKPQDKGYLPSDVIFSLYMDENQKLWIGTEEDGLIVYDTLRKKTTRYSEKNGLANNTVYAILPDLLGNVWMSTNKGLSRLEVKTQKFYNYSAADGLQGGQFNPGSALYRKSKGYMGFGGTEGLNLFYPSQVKERLNTPEVVITGLQLFNKSVKLNGLTDGLLPYEQMVGESKKIILKPDQPVFIIEFGALDYANTEKNRYAYKLDGLDKDWNYVGGQRTATYRYLEPGDYTFMVKASNHNDAWGTKYTSVQIKVLPPVWRTPLAYFLYLLLSAGLAYAVYHFSTKQKKLRRKLMLAKAQSRKERRLARERLRFFTEVSHEFRTPLTLMLGPLEEMLSKENQTTPAGRKLQLVYRNAHKLLSLINKLLDYRRAEAGSMALKVKEDNMVAFVEEVYTSFKELAQRKQIEYSLSTPDIPVFAWFDREKLEMVLNNLLSNSFKYIGKGSVIAVTIRTEEMPVEEGQGSFAIVEVKDNGIGVPAGQLKHVFDWFYQGNPVAPMSSGLGLALSKKLVQLHKGQVFVKSIEGEGAVFGFKIPLGKEHFDSDTVFTSETPLPAALPGHLLHVLPAAGEDMPTESINHRKGLKKILIVEDEEEIRKFLKDYLEDSFYLIEAINGKEGIEQARTQHPDIIISDVMMPVMDGVEMCRELKADIRTSHIPVVLLTAKTALSHHKEGLETGADAYLTKPFSPEILQLKLHNLLQSQEKLKRFYLNLFSINSLQPAKQESTLDEKFLQRIYEILKENLDNPNFNVNELSAALNMSRSLVFKKIKVLTGAAPVAYLRSLKMQEAAKLLKSGKYKVFEVACLVGFHDDKYFRQCFSKEFGYSPSDYIKSVEVAI
ncbi:response regulator [Pontibacter sp. 172403-2]|uniref:two-component regulator propeller domain-containing protein n=1 Tax=Pontibacter rufus TaxID=2791028 RepID=UPI0018AF7B78|nr:two-component regulator propeller domain-containing protein [Pontibacter sp. 172403-2]MBF9252853.1 response regulator [Pontibacter sp. 172403-2]